MTLSQPPPPAAKLLSKMRRPVSGYYEWQDTPSGKQPWYFTARDGSPALTVAGLWDEWRDNANNESTMIITEPNEFVAEVHDRMPVLLAEKDFELWLSVKRASNYSNLPPKTYCSGGQCQSG